MSRSIMSFFCAFRSLPNGPTTPAWEAGRTFAFGSAKVSVLYASSAILGSEAFGLSNYGVLLGGISALCLRLKNLLTEGLVGCLLTVAPKGEPGGEATTDANLLLSLIVLLFSLFLLAGLRVSLLVASFWIMTDFISTCLCFGPYQC